MKIRFYCTCGEVLGIHEVCISVEGNIDHQIKPCSKCLEAAEKDGFAAGQASMEGA